MLSDDDLIDALRASFSVLQPPDDLLARLRSNADAAEPALRRRRWRRRGSHQPRLRRSERSAGAFILAAGSVLAIAIAAVFVLSVNTGTRPTPQPPATRANVPAALEQLVSRLGVFRRAQTAKDRTLPAVLRRAVRLAHLGAGFGSILQGSSSALDRYIATLRDGREVFLAVYPRGRHAVPVPPGQTNPFAFASLSLITIQPDGKWTDGQPITDSGGSLTLGPRLVEATLGPGCFLGIDSRVIPDGIARVRWQFPRQDQQGYAFSAPLTVNVPVRDNVAIAYIPQRGACDQPTVITAYGPDGHVLARRGNPVTLNRVMRPIKPGNPLASLHNFPTPPHTGHATSSHPASAG
jgi:hypothetical protein